MASKYMKNMNDFNTSDNVSAFDESHVEAAAAKKAAKKSGKGQKAASAATEPAPAETPAPAPKAKGKKAKTPAATPANPVEAEMASGTSAKRDAEFAEKDTRTGMDKTVDAKSTTPYPYDRLAKPLKKSETVPEYMARIQNVPKATPSTSTPATESKTGGYGSKLPRQPTAQEESDFQAHADNVTAKEQSANAALDAELAGSSATAAPTASDSATESDTATPKKSRGKKSPQSKPYMLNTDKGGTSQPVYGTRSQAMEQAARVRQIRDASSNGRLRAFDPSKAPDAPKGDSNFYDWGSETDSSPTGGVSPAPATPSTSGGVAPSTPKGPGFVSRIGTFLGNRGRGGKNGPQGQPSSSGGQPTGGQRSTSNTGGPMQVNFGSNIGKNTNYASGGGGAGAPGISFSADAIQANQGGSNNTYGNVTGGTVGGLPKGSALSTGGNATSTGGIAASTGGNATAQNAHPRAANAGRKRPTNNTNPRTQQP
jgi:hypothetical protein